MDIYKSKYSTMPDNSYFDKRMANGDKFSEIFDALDFKYGCYTEDKSRPITVRVGNKFNYVARNFILFDNWFVCANDFEEGAQWSYAYRRKNEKGVAEGGVLIRRDGSYVTREEFLSIYVHETVNNDYAAVRQYDGLVNIIDINTGVKTHHQGIDVDCIDDFFSKGDFYRIVKGGNKTRNDIYNILNIMPNYACQQAQEMNLKFNFFHPTKGIISPSLWFDFVEPFTYVNISHSFGYQLCNHTIVYLGEKKNLLDQNGNLLSTFWFDEIYLHSDGTAQAAVIKSERVKNLPSTIGDYYELNPEKYNFYEISAYGKVKAI